MRSFIIIAVLSALAACYGASVVPSEDGYITTIYDEKSPNGTIVSNGDIEFTNERSTIYAQWESEIPTSIDRHTVSFMYVGNPSDIITSIRTGIYGEPEIVYRSPLNTNIFQMILRTRAGQRMRATIQISR
ncbi:uncharacterized protein LOC111350957 isoform X3 [Spodoptera litura]|nr:uncharacterized protein LOC111350957 isoform X3 [Spodoptera litura]